MPCVACVIVECFATVITKSTGRFDVFAGIARTMFSTVNTARITPHEVCVMIAVWGFTVQTVITGPHKSRERSDAVEMVLMMI